MVNPSLGGDINGVGEDEVTVNSGLHAQAERTNKQTEERGLPPDLHLQY